MAENQPSQIRESEKRDRAENLAVYAVLIAFLSVVGVIGYVEITETEPMENRYLDMIIVFLVRELGILIYKRGTRAGGD